MSFHSEGTVCNASPATFSRLQGGDALDEAPARDLERLPVR